MDLMSTNEAARVLGLTAESIRRLADQGRLKAVGRTAAGRVFNRRDVEALRDARAKRAGNRGDGHA